MNELIRKNVKISGFYLNRASQVQQYFEGLSNQTYGEAKYIHIYDKNASQDMTKFIVERALKMIGSEGGKGDALIAAYAEILKKRMGK